jgi:hypothetical protein
MSKLAQGELDLEPFDLSPYTLKDCPREIRLGQDQYRCTLCGVVWDIDEPRPPCQDR